MTYYTIKLTVSEKYPKLDYQCIVGIKDDIAKISSDPIIMQEQIEISFVRVTRHNFVKGIKGEIKRSAFMDLIIRLANQAFGKIPASEALLQLI